MTDQLSAHFHLSEFTTSQTASRANLDNTPPPEVVERLTDLAHTLEAVREALGHPLHINSGYRSPKVNAAVGGVPTSAHVMGYAADFICPAFGSPLEVCRKIVGTPSIHFDQIIEENGVWIHLSIDPRMRRQVLTKAAHGYQAGLRS